MNIQKIEINPNQYVWIDKNAEVKDKDVLLYNKKHIRNWDKTFNKPGMDWNVLNTNKIIAASPELKLKGIPSYARYKALEYSKPIEKEVKSESDYDWCLGAYQGFEAGYKVAEKDLFTEEDVRKAIVLSATSPTDNLIDRCDEIIEQLKQNKS